MITETVIHHGLFPISALKCAIAAGPRLHVEELSVVLSSGSAALFPELKFSGAGSKDDIRLDETLLDRLTTVSTF